MKSLYFVALLFCCFAAGAQAQTSSVKYPGRTSFYAELGGPGILFSANIDSRFKKTHLGWGGRVGLGFVTASQDEYDPVLGYSVWEQRSILTVPIQINYIFGKSTSPHTFEAGAGFTILSRKTDVFDYYYNEDGSILYGTASFMYRRQPVNGGFTWRIGFTPIVGNGFIQPSGAVGVGYNF